MEVSGVGKSRILIINLRFGNWRTFRGKVTSLHDKVLTPFLVKDFFLCLVFYFEQNAQSLSNRRDKIPGIELEIRRGGGGVVHVDAEKNGREDGTLRIINNL